jgi:hypothetical protein
MQTIRTKMNKYITNKDTFSNKIRTLSRTNWKTSLLIILFLLSCSTVEANVTTYDYATGAGVDKWIYKQEVSSQPPATNDVPNIEMVGKYAKFSLNDGQLEKGRTNGGMYPALRFQFTIQEDITDIKEIYVFWNGLFKRRGGPAGGKLYIWNFTSGSYELFGSTTLDNTEVDLTTTITTNTADYIDGNGYLHIISVGNDTNNRAETKTDYINVDITYYNTAPSLTINSATQKTDGSGQVTISIEADDTEDDDSRVSVYYGLTETTCTNKATMTGTATADIAPVPDITTSNVYQIGDDIPIKTTGTTTNTVTFNWDSKTDIPDVNGTYWLKLTINDVEFDGTPQTINLNIDNINPTNPNFPASCWRTSSKVNSISDNTWQNDDDTPYFEWTGAGDVGSGLAGYSVYWGTDPGGEPGVTLEQAQANFGETASTGDGTYYLRLRTFDNQGNYSNAITLFTFKYDNTPPTNPSAPASAWETPSKLNPITNNTWQDADNTPYFEWTGDSDGGGSGVSGYSVYWGTDSGGEPGTSKEQGAASYEVTTPVSDGTYYLRVRTFDNFNLYSNPITLFTFKYDGTAPSNPTAPCTAWDSPAKGTAISDNTAQSITQTPYFEWTGADDGTGQGVSGYSVYWGVDSGGEPGTIQEQAQANFEVTAPTGGGTFYLRVRTFDALGHYSAAVTLFTFIYDATKPTVTISVLPNPAGHRSAGELEFKLIFSEAMDTGTAPTVTYDPQGATGPQSVATAGSWSTTTYANDTYTVYNSNTIDSSTGDGTAGISVSGAKDIAGNAMLDDTDDTFVIDTTVDHFVISHDGAALVNTPEDITITAKNITNCTVLDFTGQITLSTLNETGEITWALKTGGGSFSDGGAGVDTATYTYSAADNGVVVLQVTDSSSDTLDIEATDATHNDDDTEGNLVVSTTALGWFVISHDNSAVAGIPETVTITAKDTSGITKTDYAGTISLDTDGTPGTITWALSSGSGIFSDGGASLDTATYSFHDNDNGVAVFTIKDTKVETINISVADGGITDDDTEGNLAIGPGAIDHFVISHDGTATAGAADNITVTAYDAYNNIKTNYTGTITLDTNGTATAITWALVTGSGSFVDGGAGVDTATYAYVVSDNGVVTLSITDTKTEGIDIDASGDTKTDDDTEPNLVIGPAGIDYFLITHDGSASAGVSEEITVTAKDAYANTKTDYTGTVTLDTNGTATAINWALITGSGTFVDGGAGVDTATYTFNAADNGVALFSINDTAEESINISVSGDGKTDDDTEGLLVVGPPVIWSFAISHDGNANAGVFENITITAKDSVGNIKTDYTGTITVDTNGTPTTVIWSLISGNGTFNDGGASSDTATYTYSATDSGVVTLAIKDNTQETINISVSGDGRSDDDTEGNLVVGVPLLSHFLISHDGQADAGIAESITITAKDTIGGTKTDYTGTITLDTTGTLTTITWALVSGNGSFTDDGVDLDTASYTFALADNGVVGLSLTDTLVETINISVSGDGKNDDNTEGNLVVVPGPLDHFRISHPGSGVVSIPVSVTVSSRDSNDNTITDYTGTITLDTTGTATAIGWALQSGAGSFADGGAGVDTATYTYSASDNGVVVLQLTDSANETLNISVSGDGKTDDDLEGNLVINPAGLQNTGLKSPTNGAGLFKNPERAYTDDTGTDVLKNISAKEKTGFSHQYFDYGLSFPYNAIILGAEVRVDGGVNQTGQNQRFSIELSWDGGTNFTNTGYATPVLTTSEVIYILGSATDTWGRTWSPDELSNANFRVRVINEGDTVPKPKDLYLEWMPVTIYYSIGASATANNVTTAAVGVGESDNLILHITVTNSHTSTDTVNSISVNNVGTAPDVDISAVKLYYDSNNSGDYTSGVDTQIGSGTFAGGSKTFSGLSIPVAADGGTEEFFVVVDVAAGASSGNTLDVEIPADGITLALTNTIEPTALNSTGTREIQTVLDHFVISHDGAGIAGSDEVISVTVKDNLNNTITDYTGTITLDTTGTPATITWGLQSGNGSFIDGGAGVDTATYTFSVADNGIATFTVNDTQAETINISVSGDGKSDDDTEGNLVISPGLIDHFVITHDNAAVAGTAENITVTAKDAYENTITDYAGTINIDTTGTATTITWALLSGFGSFADGGAGVDTATYTFSASDSGVVIFTVIDNTAETINISATGDGKTDDNTEGDLVVSPAGLDHFVISHDGNANAGIAESITITAQDSYANTKTDYTGTITVDTTGTPTAITWALVTGLGTFTEGGASVDTATYTYSASDSGTATLSITDTKTETINISATGDGKTDDNTEGDLVIAPGAIDHFLISHDGIATTGVAEEMTITAYDANNNVKDDYAGTITVDTTGTPTTITWTLFSGNGSLVDGGASVDTATYTYDSSDNGIVTLSITDYTPETVNISVTGDGKTDDNTEGDLQFISSGIDHFLIVHDGNAISGVAETITIYAKDANNDTLGNYQGQISIDTTGTPTTIAWALSSGNGSFSDGGASVDTATYTYSTLDNGVVVLTITDTTEETINISVSAEGKTDDNTEGDLVVNPAGLHHFSISHDGQASAGVAEAVTITAKDANNGTVTNYAGQITVDTDGTATAISWGKQTGNGSFSDGGPSVDTATYTYVASDNGQCVLIITDTKVEAVNISVSGSGKADDDTEGNLVVGPGAIDHFVIAHDGSAVAGVADNLTVTAYDTYSNIKTDYTGTIT